MALDSSQSIAACKLLNPTNQVIWLPRHKALGLLEPIHSETLAVMTPSETPHTDMNTTPTAHPHHSPETTITHTQHNTRYTLFEYEGHQHVLLSKDLKTLSPHQ